MCLQATYWGLAGNKGMYFVGITTLYGLYSLFPDEPPVRQGGFVIFFNTGILFRFALLPIWYHHAAVLGVGLTVLKDPLNDLVRCHYQYSKPLSHGASASKQSKLVMFSCAACGELQTPGCT